MNILKELGIEKICVGEVFEQALNLHEGIGIGINNTTIRIVIKYGNLTKEEIDSLKKSITIGYGCKEQNKIQYLALNTDAFTDCEIQYSINELGLDPACLNTFENGTGYGVNIILVDENSIVRAMTMFGLPTDMSNQIVQGMLSQYISNYSDKDRMLYARSVLLLQSNYTSREICRAVQTSYTVERQL